MGNYYSVRNKRLPNKMVEYVGTMENKRIPHQKTSLRI